MTQEEKAKAYDEALERARKLYNDAKANEYISDIDDYEYIFPSLAESEDERIRKCLCDIVNWLGLDSSFFLCNGVAKTDVLAYLEKQKEVKWSPSECEMGVLYKLCYVSNQITDEDDTELTRLYQDLKREYFNGHSFENMFPKEKQKEQKPVVTHGETYHVDTLGTQQVIAGKMPQKPAEWSEKYIADVFEKVGLAKIVREQGNDGLTNALQAAMIELSKVRTTEWNEEDKEMLGKVLECIRFAEDRYQLEEEGTNGISVKLWLIDHIIPQPKQEWSEEDKKMCNNILNVLTPYLVYDGTYTRTTFGKKYKYGSEIRWIKSLPERFNIQPKQEWSDEEKEILDNILSHYVLIDKPTDANGIPKEKYISLIKSIRFDTYKNYNSHWKPSEEQM